MHFLSLLSAAFLLASPSILVAAQTVNTDFVVTTLTDITQDAVEVKTTANAIQRASDFAVYLVGMGRYRVSYLDTGVHHILSSLLPSLHELPTNPKFYSDSFLTN